MTSQFRDQQLPLGFPSFIISSFQSTIYLFLAHPQLSIRESAIRAYAAFLTRSQFHVALTSLSDIMGRLQGQASPGTNLSATSGLTTGRVRTNLDGSFYYFLDAYEAEGLLGICLFIIKVMVGGGWICLCLSSQ